MLLAGHDIDAETFLMLEEKDFSDMGLSIGVKRRLLTKRNSILNPSELQVLMMGCGTENFGYCLNLKLVEGRPGFYKIYCFSNNFCTILGEFSVMYCSSCGYGALFLGSW